MSQPIINENAKLVHKSHCRIGEGVIWSVAEQAIYWTDILGNIVYRHKNNVTEYWPLQQSLTSIGFTTDNTLVGTFYDGFYALDLVNGVHKKNSGA